MNDARYRLVIHSYPAEDIIPRVCRLLYGSTDKNLLASLSSLPYIVGRSFSLREVDDLEGLLRQCEVGFTFKSSTDGFPDRHFDPKKPHQKDSESFSLDSKVIRSIPKRVLISGMLIGLLAASFLLIKWDLKIIQDYQESQTAKRVSAEFYARVSQLINTVDIKTKSSLVWERAKENMNLQQEDSVRTYDRSSAKVDYANGSSISIKPNTLLVIGRSETEIEKRIDLDDGSIQTRLIGSKTPYKMSIHTKAGIIEVKSPTKPNEESRLETKITGNDLKVTVSEGRATLVPSNPEMKPVEITQQQSVSASKSAISQPITPATIARPKPMELLSPPTDSRIKVNPQDSQPISFECQDLGGDVYYIWELASDQNMQNVLLRQTTQQPKLKVNYLDLGTFYWRVVAESHDARFMSQPRRLYVEKQHD